MIRRRRRPGGDGVNGLLAETKDLVQRLVREHRALRQENLKLARELERVSKGWEKIRELARQAPRKPRGR